MDHIHRPSFPLRCSHSLGRSHFRRLGRRGPGVVLVVRIVLGLGVRVVLVILGADVPLASHQFVRLGRAAGAVRIRNRLDFAAVDGVEERGEDRPGGLCINQDDFRCLNKGIWEFVTCTSELLFYKFKWITMYQTIHVLSRNGPEL